MSGWHAKLSASSSPRWMACPGSVRECEGIKSSSSVYAATGTVAHEIAARCFRRTILPDQFLGEVIEQDGYQIEVDQEMVDAVWEYVKYVDWADVEAGRDRRTHVEVSLTEALQKLHPELGGTADFVLWSPQNRTLDVIDYKHGSGVLVSVAGNKQLTYYALGALLTFPEYTPEKVRLTVVQPRCESADPVRTHEFDTFELLEFEADLVEAAKRTEDPNAPLVPGDHCKEYFCPAAHKCPALQERTTALVSAEFDDLTTVSSFDLEAALEILPAVESRCKAIREYAYHQAVAGNPPKGWKLVDKKGRRQWTDPEAAQELAEMVVDSETLEHLFTPRQFKTVAQVERELGKAEFAKLLGELTAMVSSGYTLVKESDKRPPANLGAADAGEFTQLESQD